TELTRWGRSTADLQNTLVQLQAWDVSIIAQTGLEFNLSTPQGRLIANLMCSLAEFERDLMRERIKSGLASARARGKILGRRTGQHIKADRLAPKVLAMIADKKSYRYISKELQISKTTVVEIVKRDRHFPIASVITDLSESR
ncbi:MAG: recombinase family protein, partial [Chroococcidiopsis sp.]